MKVTPFVRCGTGLKKYQTAQRRLKFHVAVHPVICEETQKSCGVAPVATTHDMPTAADQSKPGGFRQAL